MKVCYTNCTNFICLDDDGGDDSDSDNDCDDYDNDEYYNGDDGKN